VIGRIKALVLAVVNRVALGFGHLSLSWILWRTGPRPMTVLDVDNTLSDSWPTLVDRVASERERLAGLAPLPGMAAAAHDTAVARGDVIVYLTHRSFWYEPLTVRWLRRAGFGASSLRVILVPSAAAKLPFLRRIADGSRSVEYWDDLSRGTELGTTILYAEVIDEVRRLPLTYHDIDEIAAVTAAAGLVRDDR